MRICSALANLSAARIAVSRCKALPLALARGFVQLACKYNTPTPTSPRAIAVATGGHGCERGVASARGAGQPQRGNKGGGGGLALGWVGQLTGGFTKVGRGAGRGRWRCGELQAVGEYSACLSLPCLAPEYPQPAHLRAHTRSPMFSLCSLTHAHHIRYAVRSFACAPRVARTHAHDLYPHAVYVCAAGAAAGLPV